MIAMQPIRSTNIQQAGYDAATQTLAVQFHSGATWHYAGVPPGIAEAFAQAPSPGQFLRAHIVGKFAGEAQPKGA
jgi:KTSC domain